MKKVLVQVADKNYLNHTKSLFVNAKTRGEWDGDFCLIANNISEEDLKDFKDTNIIVVNKNISNYYYATMFIFEEYFKQWDVVLYMDCDVMILDSLKDIIYPKTDEMFMDPEPFTIESYFCQGWEQNTRQNTIQKLRQQFNFIDNWGYNAGCIFFNTSLIKNNTISEIFHLQQYLQPINNHTSEMGSDQPLINLYFYPHIQSKLFCSYWGKPKEGSKALHFCRWRAPWINNSYFDKFGKTIFEEYRDNLNLFSKVMKK